MADGSQTTRGGWEPKECCICGGRVVMTGPKALRFHFNDITGERRSWHVACERKEPADAA